MSAPGEWIANCKPDRIERISAASVFELAVGPPRANQLQDQQELEDEGIVGLYRVQKKEAKQIQKDQARYLADSAFMPVPESLAAFVGPAAARKSGSA